MKRGANLGFKILTVFSVTILVCEIIVRISGEFKVYPEKLGLSYVTYYNEVRPSQLWTYAVKDTFDMNHGEFNFRYQTSSLGIREKELLEKKADSTIRIITVGDSFTDGVGADYDSSYPRQLERLLNKDRNTYEVMNAGVSGSDPFYCYSFYKEKLKYYHPDVLIVAVGASDLTDYLFRGGMERFKPDGTTEFKRAPWYEPLYHYSHLARFFIQAAFKCDETLLPRQKREQNISNACKDLTQCLVMLNDSCSANGCELKVVFYPISGEIHSKPKTQLLNYYVIDDLEPVLIALKAKHVCAESIKPCLAGMVAPENLSHYFWQTDGHYNANGYAVFGVCVFSQFSPWPTVEKKGNESI